MSEILRKGDSRLPDGVVDWMGTMPFNDRYELVGFRLQLSGKTAKDTKIAEEVLIPVWKDHAICRKYAKGKY